MGDPFLPSAMEEGPFSLHSDVPQSDIDPEFKGWAPPPSAERGPPFQDISFPGRRIVAPRRGYMPLPVVTDAAEIRALHGMLDNMRRRVDEDAARALAALEAMEQRVSACQSTVCMMADQIDALRRELDRIVQRLEPGAEAMIAALNQRIDAAQERK